MRAAGAFDALPVVIVAYSGGYYPTRWALHHGGIGDRLRGIILLDALYSDYDKFANWIAARESRLLLQRLLALGPRRECQPCSAC